jgi:hypothetical protein
MASAQPVTRDFWRAIKIDFHIQEDGSAGCDRSNQESYPRGRYTILDDGYTGRPPLFPSTELSFDDCGQLTARRRWKESPSERPRGVRTIDGRDEAWAKKKKDGGCEKR